MSDLLLHHRHLPGITVVTIAGELDGTNNEALESYIKDARRASGEQLVLDLTEPSFMDSSGLRVLLDTYHLTSREGAHVQLGNPRGEPARLLSATKVDTILRAHSSVTEAIDEASKPEPIAAESRQLPS
ncbi:STAS domain-containing protein [Nonomuraea sp. B12E4]